MMSGPYPDAILLFLNKVTIMPYYYPRTSAILINWPLTFAGMTLDMVLLTHYQQIVTYLQRYIAAFFAINAYIH
jgi:hypothetical protein